MMVNTKIFSGTPTDLWGTILNNLLAMKKHSTQQWIEPLIETVEAHLVRATNVYQHLSDEQLTTLPPDDGWSVAQCLDHLNSYGHFYLPAAKKALRSVVGTVESSAVTYQSGWVGHYFIDLMKPENTKKFKAFKGHIPAIKLDGMAVVAEFIGQQEQWLHFLAEITSIAQLNARIPISISPLIRLKLGDVFGFVTAHSARHIQQADRVLASLTEKV